MKKFLTIATLALGAFLATRGTAQAQAYDCVIVDGQKCYIYQNDDGTLDTLCDTGSSGKGEFKSSSGPIPDKGDVNTTLDASAITATIQDPTYGTITTTLDESRQASSSTITSHKAGSRYPLDVALNFYANATVSGLGDKTYESSTELNFSGSDINSVLPFKNETLTLQNDVDFYEKGDERHTTVFTLQAGSTSVTLGSSDGGGDNGEVR